MALGAVLQMVALGVPSSAVRGSALVPLSGQPITGPGLSQPGLYLRMPDGELDTYPAEGAGTQPTFAPPPKEPAPAYFPSVLFPATPTPVEAATARVTAEGGQLTRDEMFAVLRATGWPEGVISEAIAVSWCESKWSPYASGDSGRSRGLFQLNVATWFSYAGADPDLWADPLTNARVAWLTYQYDLGRGYAPWTQWSCKP